MEPEGIIEPWNAIVDGKSQRDCEGLKSRASGKTAKSGRLSRHRWGGVFLDSAISPPILMS